MQHQDFDLTSGLFGANTAYIEEMYELYKKNKSAVLPEWQHFFSGFDDHTARARAAWGINDQKIVGAASSDDAKKPAKDAKGKSDGKAVAPAAAPDSTTIDQTVRALRMVHAYRVRGHLIANLDPLGLEERSYAPDLDPASYGFSESDYDTPIFLGGTLGLETATLREILSVLKQTYCGTIGVEFMHIQDPNQRLWIQQHIESAKGDPQATPEEKHQILSDLIEVEAFEEFLQVKNPGAKRFSVQGGDSMISGLEIAISRAAELGVEEIVIGMPHRGRLNVLTTVMGKPYAEMFSLFHGNLDFPEWVGSSGDVKYHLGASCDRPLPDGKLLHMSLTSNPSHLEIVNPVVCGKVRAKMDQRKDETKKRVMGVQLHGDAAFAGQGSVPETLALSELRGYRTGGSLHIIVNNQIGFTTAPKYSRFTPYPSDVAKMVQAPIFHVNGEDAEAVAYVCKLAVEFRQEFQRDVVVDIVCYRKYGHNEGDEPMFTQPVMYTIIKKKESPATIYAKQLISEGFMSQEEVDQEFSEFKTFFDEQYEAARDFRPNKAQWLEGYWSGFKRPEQLDRDEPATGIEQKTLKEILADITKWPNDFTLNSKLERFLKARAQMGETGEGIDWATGEALAFCTLLKEGHGVRLSGQDSGRGTFTQRHSVFIDQTNENRYEPYNHLTGPQARYEVIDSSLSELAVLGFEYGYSLAEPNALTLWEAQFGDFVNGAQVVIDQFIASGEIKWLRMSGLVMLLPHGYEGQGPEHSSARPERFLQQCAEDNMQVCNLTTPANYFHALRRQLHRNFRKPLVIMTPKSLLRHKLAISSLKDFDKGTTFKKLYPEAAKLAADGKVRRVVFCSGKVYYDLVQARDEAKINDIAILRVEQLYPFPQKEVVAELKRYKNAEVIWCQEEPENMGGWRFVQSYLLNAMAEAGMDARIVEYTGRKAAASPAVGYLKIHEKEQKELVQSALADIRQSSSRKKAGN